jgi:pyruvate-ferredoxin/flavodoxin oxidoreductase
VWPLYRYNPALAAEGTNPLSIDSKAPTLPVKEYAYQETRYRALTLTDAKRAAMLIQLAQQDAEQRWDRYSQLAALSFEAEDKGEGDQSDD